MPEIAEFPVQEMRMNMEILTDGLHKAIGVVKATGYTLKAQVAAVAEKTESRVESAVENEARVAGELSSRTRELAEARASLEACHGEIEAERARAAAVSESRLAIQQDLADANSKMVSSSGVRAGVHGELQQVREELSARHAELRQAREELRACGEGSSAARMREGELEERMAGLREAERVLHAEIKGTQVALQAELGKAQAELEETQAAVKNTREELSRNERDLRGELAVVQAELGATRAELQRRQKCCFRLRTKRAATPKEDTVPEAGSRAALADAQACTGGA